MLTDMTNVLRPREARSDKELPMHQHISASRHATPHALHCSLLAALASVVSCTSEPRSNDESDMNVDQSCLTDIGADGTLTSECAYGLILNGDERGNTKSEIKFEGARGPGGAISATTIFDGDATRPDGGVIKVRLSDEGGYELDAGMDGKIQVKPAEIDPADPEAAVDSVTVALTQGSGSKDVYTVSCPGLYAFALSLEESGHELDPGGSCPEDLGRPDEETGCFRCDALADTIRKWSGYSDGAIRSRLVITSDYAGELYKKHGGGARAEVVQGVVALVSKLVTDTNKNGVQCKFAYDRRFTFDCLIKFG